MRRISLMAQKNAPLRLSFSEGELRSRRRRPTSARPASRCRSRSPANRSRSGSTRSSCAAGLESAGADELVLKLISPLRPGLMEAADGSGFLYLIMPIRLNV